MAEIAFYNLERTICDFVPRSTIQDIGDAGLKPPKRITEALPSVREDNKMLINWFIGKTQADIEPLLDITIQRMSERLATWARLSMGAHNIGKKALTLYSDKSPQPLLEARARGIEKTLPGVRIESVYGKPVVQDRDGSIKGFGYINRMSVLKGLVERGNTIDFFADSFAEGTAVAKTAKRPVMVNLYIPPKQRIYDLDRIYWSAFEPLITRFQHAHASRSLEFDLSLNSDRLELLGLILN